MLRCTLVVFELAAALGTGCSDCQADQAVLQVALISGLRLVYCSQVLTASIAVVMYQCVSVLHDARGSKPSRCRMQEKVEDLSFSDKLASLPSMRGDFMDLSGANALKLC